MGTPRVVSRDTFLDHIAGRVAADFVNPMLANSEEGEDYVEKDLETLEADPLVWAAEMFPNYIKGSFSRWQKAFWLWVWTIRFGIAPRHYAMFWPRGHAKTATALMAVVALLATKRRKYVLFVAATQEQAERQMNKLIQMLESSRVDRYYPHLGSRQATKFNIRRNWNATRVVTAGGTIIDAVGLNQAVRGLGYEDLRPDLIVADDIDTRHESPQMTRKKREVITESILPAGSKDVAVIFAQNIIREGGIAHEISTGAADYLVNIERSGPYPALRGARIIPAKDRKSGYEIVEGDPSWEWFDRAACQHLLDTIGLQAFLREVQQDFRRKARGRIWADLYDERIHVITWPEFAAVYPRAAVYNREGEIVRYRIPRDWKLACTQDWGTNDDHPCVTIHAARPGELDPFNDTRFLYRETMYPQPYEDTIDDESVDSEDLEKVTPNRVGAAIWRAEQPDGETARVEFRVNSHEQKTVRNAYMRDLPIYLKNPKAKLNFAAFNTHGASDTGVDAVRNLLDPLPEPNPFRSYPIGHPREGDAIWGRPRLVIIVDEGEGELAYDETQTDDVLVMPATSHRGFSRLRWEIPNYQYDETLSGKLKRVPLAEGNDAADALRMFADYWGPNVAKDTVDAKVQRQMETDPKYKHLTPEAIAARPDGEAQAAALQTRHMIEEKLRAQQEKKAKNGSVVEHRFTTRTNTRRGRKERDEEDRRWL